jgi:hypothetical protein
LGRGANRRFAQAGLALIVRLALLRLALLLLAILLMAMSALVLPVLRGGGKSNGRGEQDQGDLVPFTTHVGQLLGVEAADATFAA